MSVSLAGPSEALARFVEASRSAPAEPYRSLEPFRFADAGILAARDGEIERLVRLVTMYRGVLLYGESGTGKTSVVNAGVLPRLTEDGFWPHRVRVQPRSGEELVLEAITCSDAQHDAFLPSAFDGAAEDGRLMLAADELEPAVTSATSRGSILLVFDQFEELVTLFPKARKFTDTQARIVDGIVCLLRDGHVRVKMLFVFREDYLANLKPLLEEQPELAHQSLRLVPPPLECAKEIIRAPFERFPADFRRELPPELAERIAGSLAQRSVREDLNLSELQIVCRRLWEADDPSALLEQRGVEGLLEDHLNEALERFPPNLRVAAIALLGHMITPSGTRNVIAAHDLVQRASEEQEDLKPPLLQEAIELLETDSGLIRRERRHDLDLYELTSEFLIPWISRRADELREVRARRRERRRMLILGSITGAIAIVLAIVAVLAAVAIEQQRTAQAQKARATYVGLASTAQALLASRPDVSLLLALEAYRQRPNGVPDTLAQSSLLAALEEVWRSGSIRLLHGHSDTVTSVAFSPNGGMLASASGDGTIRLWKATSGRQVAELKLRNPDGVFSVAFSPDGRRIAGAYQDGTLRLWDVASHRPVWRALPSLRGIVISVAFSPNGRRLAAASLDGTIALWNVANDEPLGRATDLTEPGVRSVAFSPDSKTLAAVGSKAKITLWDAVTGQRGRSHYVNTPLYTVGFGRAGRILAAGGLAGGVWLWDLGSRNARPRHLRSSTRGAVDGVAFTRDGHTLASAQADGTIQLWDVDTRMPQGRPLAGHTGVVTSVAFSPDAHTLASGSTDRTIRLWDPRSAPPFGHTLTRPSGSVSVVAFTRDGQELAWAHNNRRLGTIELWDVAHDRRITAVRTHETVRSIAFSPNGRLLVSASQRGTVELWDIPSWNRHGPAIKNARGSVFSVAFSPIGQTLAFAGVNGTLMWKNLVTGHTCSPDATSAAVFSVAFNHAGTMLASAGDDRNIRLWKVATCRRIAVLSDNTDAVFSIAFSPNDRILASGSADDTVRLWDVKKDKRIGPPLTGHREWVRTVAFSPDGRRLASGSTDGTIRLWDVASHAQLGEALTANQSATESVAFSRDGVLVSGGTDGAVRMWPGILLPQNYPGLQAEICSLEGEGLSRSEWSQYAPDLHPHDSCR